MASANTIAQPLLESSATSVASSNADDATVAPEGAPAAHHKNQLATLNGVFVPCCLNIMGIVSTAIERVWSDACVSRSQRTAGEQICSFVHEDRRGCIRSPGCPTHAIYVPSPISAYPAVYPYTHTLWLFCFSFSATTPPPSRS